MSLENEQIKLLGKSVSNALTELANMGSEFHRRLSEVQQLFDQWQELVSRTLEVPKPAEIVQPPQAVHPVQVVLPPPAVDDEQGLLMTVKEATALTGLSKSTIYRFIADGHLVPRKFGSMSRLVRDEVVAFVLNRPNEAKDNIPPRRVMPPVNLDVFHTEMLRRHRDIEAERQTILESNRKSRVKIAQMAMDLRVDGVSNRDIAGALNANNVPHQDGGQWTTQKIVSLLDRHLWWIGEGDISFIKNLPGVVVTADKQDLFAGDGCWVMAEALYDVITALGQPVDLVIDATTAYPYVRIENRLYDYRGELPDGDISVRTFSEFRREFIPKSEGVWSQTQGLLEDRRRLARSLIYRAMHGKKLPVEHPSSSVPV